MDSIQGFLIMLLGYVPRVVGALLLLIVGLFVIGKIGKLLAKSLDKSKMDDTLKPFLVSLVTVALKVVLAISVIGMFGIEVTSFIAILGAAGLAIGLAFQGALSNLAGGVLLLTLRPFNKDDYINAAGYEGVVDSIHIFNTVLTTLDNKVVSIPNGVMANSSVVNYNVKATRRVDLNFGVGYEQDIDKVAAILNEVCANHSLVRKDPAPFVKLSEHADSAIIFVVRVWVNTADYWTVYFDLMETVKKRFDQEKVSIPYPQLDVHMDK